MLPKTLSRTVLAAIFAVTFLTASAAQVPSYTVLFNFTGGATGANPETALAIDQAGHLYGTTEQGGSESGPVCSNIAGGCGLIFKLEHTNSGWIENVLYEFQGGTDGLLPSSRLVFGPDGSLFGTTRQGGGAGCGGYGCGTVFKLTPPPTVCKSISCPWTETVLYRFTGNNGGNDAFPVGALVFDQSGNIYGATNSEYGEVYELTPTNDGWAETVLYTFNEDPAGAPTGGVTFDSAGNLYGPLEGAGQYPFGVIYQLVNTDAGWTENIIYAFNDTDDGAGPNGSLIVGGGGGSICLAGTTNRGAVGIGGMPLSSGTAFSLCTDNGGWEIFSYWVGTYGYTGPEDSLAQDAAGNLYGTYQVSVFEVGNLYGIPLHDFEGGESGVSNYTGVVLDSSGNIYGTAGGGSSPNCQNGCGLVYEITP
jgi:hypothetical protein